jgi:DeoR family fructose operon transcriptional repressor
MGKLVEIKRLDSLLPSERRQRIVDLLKEGIAIRVARLSELLAVSEMTIRRDLAVLEEQGWVDRAHGGAVFKQNRRIDKFQYEKNIQINLPEKQRIAKTAASLIEPHDVIYLGEGTTTPLVIRYADAEMPFKVFTNNYGAIPEIQDKRLELILLGGSYNPATHTVAGPLTMETIRQVYATKVFLGADGISPAAGLTTPDLEMATIERAMIRHTRGQVIVMADHSKFGLVAEMVIAPLKRADVLITDHELSDEFQKDLESMRIRILVV